MNLNVTYDFKKFGVPLDFSRAPQVGNRCFSKNDFVRLADQIPGKGVCHQEDQDEREKTDGTDRTFGEVQEELRGQTKGSRKVQPGCKSVGPGD